MATSMARRVVIGTNLLRNYARTVGAITTNQGSNQGKFNLDRFSVPSYAHAKRLHTTRHLCGLGEFFDDPETFEEEKVLCGRPWLKDELRLKSNTDLHKLWYVLLKERNRLLTMDALYKDESLNMPSPERIDKVEESMENLAAVVNERNRAYEMLETGKSSEPKQVWRKTVLNQWRLTYETEHYEPKHKNKEYMESIRQDPQWMIKYKKLLREKEEKKAVYKEAQLKKERKEMQEAFPHLKIAAEE